MEAPLEPPLPALHDVVGVLRACFGISTVSAILVMFSDVRLTDKERERKRERVLHRERERRRESKNEKERKGAGGELQVNIVVLPCWRRYWQTISVRLRYWANGPSASAATTTTTRRRRRSTVITKAKRNKCLK